MRRLRDPGWWYWTVTAALLAAGLAGWSQGFLLAIAVTGIQIVHYLLKTGSPASFPVQVRIGYALLLSMGLWEPLRPVYWLPLLGTLALILFGYCPMARFLSLMPWNRRLPMSASLVACTILSPPVEGSFLDYIAERMSA